MTGGFMSTCQASTLNGSPHTRSSSSTRWVKWVASRFGVELPADRTAVWGLNNATRCAKAGADVAMMQRDGEHGSAFWGEEFPLMVAWALAP